MKTTEEKLRYEVFCLRISEQTKQRLKIKKQRSGLSWNKFIMSLLNKNEQKFKNKQ
jgi:predicted HicB family RNase H-like nuclease